MDIFDQYIFDELVKEYNQPEISEDDYEELYQRFCNMSHLTEAKPYIYVMRFLGKGTDADEDGVLSELNDEQKSGDIELSGLYYDLQLFSNPHNTTAIVELRRLIEDGYCGKYLKNMTHIHAVNKEPDTPKKSEMAAPSDVAPEKFKYKSISFESCGYHGLYFTAGDIDYLSARVFFEPLKTARKLKIRSQIFSGESTFSDIMTNEYNLQPGAQNVLTTGWGNKNFYGYSDGIYKWVIEVDNDVTYSQEFRIYGGKLTKAGIPVKDVKLFSSKASGALEADREQYKLSFDSSSLEYIYFKFFIDPPGKDMTVQIWIKVTCLEDNTNFCDKYFLHKLESNTIACWNGVGYSTRGKWKKGLYKYYVSIGTGTKHEGTFTIY